MNKPKCVGSKQTDRSGGMKRARQCEQSACWKTNIEQSQMDFPLRSSLNERKQGSASQGLHCDPKTGPPSAACLKEFGPMSYLPVIVRDGNPHLGYMNTAAQHPSLG